jgi:hypothetical protein
MVLRFVSDDVWGGAGTCREAAGLIADYLVHAWDHRNACKHNVFGCGCGRTQGLIKYMSSHTPFLYDTGVDK